MRKGTLWRVGDGKPIRVMKDLWLCDRNPTMETETDAFLESLTVSDLIDDKTGQWNEEMIDLYFCDQDKERILSITLSARKRDDNFFWFFHKRGCYIVRTTYHIQT